MYELVKMLFKPLMLTSTGKANITVKHKLCITNLLNILFMELSLSLAIYVTKKTEIDYSMGVGVQYPV